MITAVCISYLQVQEFLYTFLPLDVTINVSMGNYTNLALPAACFIVLMLCEYNTGTECFCTYLPLDVVLLAMGELCKLNCLTLFVLICNF